MKIKVRLFTGLTEYVPEHKPGETFTAETAEKSDLTGLLRQLHIPPGEAKIMMVNGRAKPAEYLLKENDEVAIFPAIGGG